tara:strand:+ start:441 stop:650 length:210 start_codon:yes stop_codon:yes gene_type:complete
MITVLQKIQLSENKYEYKIQNGDSFIIMIQDADMTESEIQNLITEQETREAEYATEKAKFEENLKNFGE